MRIALLSDIHSNIHALDACLNHARTQNTQRFVFLGDLVGYGADPTAVVERVQALQADGALVLRGNHEELAIFPPKEAQTMGDNTAAWTHEQLTQEHRDWLAQLPLQHRQDQCLFVHASADEPQKWRYVYDQRSAKASMDAATQSGEVRYIFGGHVHLQTLFYRGAGTGDLMAFKPKNGIAVPVPKHRQWLCTVGSVGQPRDGNTHAMYSVFDSERCQLTFHRVPYDHHAAANAIRRVGLDEFFADRLEEGR